MVPFASLPRRHVQESPPDGRLSGEAYKIPRRFRWSCSSFLFSFLSLPAGLVCTIQDLLHLPPYIAAPSQAKALLILLQFIAALH